MTSNIFRRHFDLFFIRLCATFTTTTLVNLPFIYSTLGYISHVQPAQLDYRFEVPLLDYQVPLL